MPRNNDDAVSTTSSRPTTPHSHHSRSHSRASNDIGTAFFSSSPVSAHSDLVGSSGAEDDSDGVGEETIGRTAGRHVSISSSRGNLQSLSNPPAHSHSASPSPVPGANGARRTRPQSMYAPITSQALSAPAPITPLNVRLRSRSTDRFNGSGLGLGLPETAPTTPATGKFVDPLVARRQQQAKGVSQPKPLVGKTKVPVGDLVAFFDQEKA